MVGEIGNDILIDPFRNLETGHAQTHVVFGMSIRDIVKGNRFAYIAVQGLQFRVQPSAFGV